MWDIVGILSTPSRSSSTTSTRLSTTALSGSTRTTLESLSLSTLDMALVRLRTWLCRMLHTYPAERGARYAWRHIIPLYPCCTSRRRGILHRIVHRSLLEDPLLQITARHACDRDRDA